MARVVTTVLVDDLEGEEGDSVDTVMFGFDGASYEIDLSEGNREKMAAALAPYIRAGRSTGGRRKSRNGAGPNSSPERTDKEQLDAIRSWARANGHEVSDRGRISKSVRDAYEAAH